MQPIRQTQSYLKNLFSQRGIFPRHRLGQNFLVDLNIHDLIVNAAEVGSSDLILEVGSGTGALTAHMAGRGATIVTVDVDAAMTKLTSDLVAGMPNVRVLNLDALKNKNTIHPGVIDAVRAGMAVDTQRPFKIVANLPYHVATPVISNFLVHPELCPALMVVTIQRELADRMCSQPATAAYGSLSVLMQALADVSIVRTLPPSVFWPQPKVDSAVVAILPNATKRAAVGDVPWFHNFVRSIFLHRRKYLRQVLSGIWRDRWTKMEVDAWLESQGISGQVRAEALNLDEFLTMAHSLQQRWSTLPAVTIEDSDGDESEVAV
jgi:16S rRNA (adenine1518-N6/adenine1519-N6)-dimethyltransferase